MLYDKYKKELVDLMKKLAPKYNLHNVFRDFTALSAYAISNTVDIAQRAKREEYYMRIVKQYEKDEAQLFADMFELVVKGLSHEMRDMLGEVYMELQLGNDDAGQFFTPYHAAELMSEIAIKDSLKKIGENGYIELNEPAVGGGVTIITFAKALKKRDYNYQKCLKVTAQDIDTNLVHMCYVQLSLLGIDAVVMRGDSIAYKFNDFWYTPMHVLNKRKQDKYSRILEIIRRDVP